MECEECPRNLIFTKTFLLFFDFSSKSSENFHIFWHRNSYLVLAIQHDVNNVALFVALHFLYLVLSRSRVRFISFPLFSLLTLVVSVFLSSFTFCNGEKVIQFISAPENPFVFSLPFSCTTETKRGPEKKLSSSSIYSTAQANVLMETSEEKHNRKRHFFLHKHKWVKFSLFLCPFFIHPELGGEFVCGWRERMKIVY